MLKKSASFVLGSSKSSTGIRPPHHSAARTDVVLLIRRTVCPRGCASGFGSPAALLDGHFEHPASRVYAVTTGKVRVDFEPMLTFAAAYMGSDPIGNES